MCLTALRESIVPEADRDTVIRSGLEKVEHLTLITGGGGGNSGGMDVPIKDYVDARMGEAKAANDARFAEVIFKIDGLSTQITAIPSTWKVIGIVVSALGVSLGLVFAVIAFGGDRFDAGMGAASVDGALVRRIEAAIEQSAQSNEELSARVDQTNARTDQIIRLISAPPPAETPPEN